MSHIRSFSKSGLTATVVIVQRWLGSRVTLMLSLTGKIKASSLFPQYLITAMLVGVCAVVISTHFPPSNSLEIAMEATSPIKYNEETSKFQGERTRRKKMRETNLEREREREARSVGWNASEVGSYSLEVKLKKAGRHCGRSFYEIEYLPSRGLRLLAWRLVPLASTSFITKLFFSRAPQSTPRDQVCPPLFFLPFYPINFLFIFTCKLKILKFYYTKI